MMWTSAIIAAIVLVCAQFSIQYNPNDGVNQGASTSRQVDCERCEISNYAEQLVRLLLAQDTDAAELDILFHHNNPAALQAFHDEVMSYVLMAERGAQAYTDPRPRARRLDIMNVMIQMHISEAIRNSEEHHNHTRVTYAYENNVIRVREHVTRNPNIPCLCANFEERVLLSGPFPRPELEWPRQPILQYVGMEGRIYMAQTRRYHVIPLQLISRFLHVWLQQDDFMSLQRNQNRCVATLLGRLKRSLQKLVLAKLRGAQSSLGEVPLNADPDDLFSVEILEQTGHWLDWNSFIGPPYRGPADPLYGLFSELDREEAFEYDASVIIGEAHFGDLLFLFTEIKEFLDDAMFMDPLMRLLQGFDRFFTILNYSSRYGVTVMNMDHWMENVSEEDGRYWVIRRPPKRDPRSVKQQDDMSTHKVSVQDQWSIFVTEVLKTAANHSMHNKTCEPWLHEFDCMYNDYFDGHAHQLERGGADDCSSCTSFDQYLYSRIPNLDEWNRCNRYNESSPETDWCQAWRYITKDMNTAVALKSYHKSERPKQGKRSTLNLNDVKTIVTWLSTSPAPKKTVRRKPLVLSGPYGPTSGDGTAETVICYLTTFLASVVIRDSAGCSMFKKVHHVNSH